MTKRRFLVLAGVLVAGIVASLTFGRLDDPFGSVGYRKLRMPFSKFPTKVGDWTGEDRPLDETARGIARMDRYLRREYRATDGRGVMLYLAYYGNKRKGLRTIYHNPTVCFPAAGWEWVGSEQKRITPLKTAEPFDVSLDTFRRGARQLTVLNFFVIDGKILEKSPRNKPFHLALEKFVPSSGPGYFAQAQILCSPVRPGEDAGRTAVEFLEEAGHLIFLHF